MTSKNMSEKLINDEQLPQLTPQMSRIASIVAGIDWHDFDYKEKAEEPRINFSTISLIVLVPILIVGHIQTAKLFSIPILQYTFLAFLITFLANYLTILRKFQLMPFLPNQQNDNRLKLVCVVFYAANILSIFVGWNGSGGMLFAIIWESIRGSKMGTYKYFFLSIIVGSIILENNYSITKLFEFIPGILYGFINTQISKLKISNPYPIVHQLVFFSSMLLPIFFAASNMIVPSLLQWGVIIVGGFLMMFTILAAIQLMQNGRVSVVTGVISGIVMLGTANYVNSMDIVGLVLILGGLIFLVKQEYYSSDY